MAIPRKTGKVSFVPLSSMADIAFILLIFFILTAAVDMEKNIPVSLPVSSVSASPSGGYFHVWIDSSGAVHINGQPVSADDLVISAKSRAASNPTVRGLIGADRGVPFSAVNRVMEQLSDSGVYNITLLTKKKGGNI
jgi:biopolymer transport protein ExbD